MKNETEATAAIAVERETLAQFREAAARHGKSAEQILNSFMKDYISHAKNDRDDRWVQIDLGSSQLIDGIKVLPASNLWGERTGGFPSHFRIEVSDDPDFKEYIRYEDMTKANGFPDPGDKVLTFATKIVKARYVRFSAARLRDSKLCLTKIMVMQNGKDIAVGCKVTESNPVPYHLNVISIIVHPSEITKN